MEGKATDSRKRAAKLGVAGTYTPAQIQEQLHRQKFRCYYLACGQAKFQRIKQPNGKWKYIFEVDHTFPLSRVAGTDIPANDISYLVLACPKCNRQKQARYPHEWIAGGRLL
jgi:CRISPR/Cas system Type II protein with McrA/HNH and RuvC-like nuclease domain